MKHASQFLKPLLFTLGITAAIQTASAQAPAIQWQKTIGSAGYDFLNSIVQTSDGGYIMGGYSDGNSAGFSDMSHFISVVGCSLVSSALFVFFGCAMRLSSSGNECTEFTGCLWVLFGACCVRQYSTAASNI